jgi:hypothetical protein
MKKLNDLGVKENYQVEISNRYFKHTATKNSAE